MKVCDKSYMTSYQRVCEQSFDSCIYWDAKNKRCKHDKKR